MYTPQPTCNTVSESSPVLSGRDLSSLTQLEATNVTDNEIGQHFVASPEDPPRVTPLPLNSIFIELDFDKPTSLTDSHSSVVDIAAEQNFTPLARDDDTCHDKTTAADGTDIVVVIDSGDSDDEKMEKSEHFVV